MDTPWVAELQAKLDTEGAAAAMTLCREHLAASPGDADAHRHLGQLHALAGEFFEAHRSARRACELAPGDARCFSDLARVHAVQGQFPEAATLCEQALRIDPRCADAWHNLGTARKKLGDLEGAFAALKNALLVDSTRAETYLNLGNLLITADQFDDAVECFERAALHDPGLAVARHRLAAELSSRGKVRRAESLFRQSLGLDPNGVEGWFGLGRTLEDVGEADSALSCYMNVFERQPGHAAAIGRYLALVDGEADSCLFETALRLRDQAGVPAEAKALVGYGLVRFHDRRRAFDRAAEAGRTANAARRRRCGPLDRPQLRARVDGIIGTYSRDFFSARRHSGLGNDQPVFIVGLPRSGTTLSEQILAAHPDLDGAGELPDLARIASRSVSKGRAAWLAAAELDVAQSRACAQAYLDVLHDRAQKHRRRISDKSPLNFFQLAFAALLFPQSRIIHCVREPRDNALSIWMENFNPDQHYATDFGDIAFFHAEYQRLMAHWLAHLPLPVLEVRYEDTVGSLEAQARRLIEFLDVPWDPACLRFHESRRAVQTPSRWQVRQPLYSRSVGRWRHYRAHLPELETAFQ